MKKQALSMLATSALILTLGAAAGYAQDRVVAHIPFGFSVGRTELPAGDYNFVKLSQSNWVIQNNDGGASALTIVSPARVGRIDDRGKLVFKHYGDHYFLSLISREGISLSVPRSKLERELAKNGAKADHVTVAARQ